MTPKQLPDVTPTKYGRLTSATRSSDTGPRRMSVEDGLKEAIVKQGINKPPYFDKDSPIILTTGASRHASAS